MFTTLFYLVGEGLLILVSNDDALFRMVIISSLFKMRFNKETEKSDHHSYHQKEKAPDYQELSSISAVWTRLELATPCVTGMYSNQLNYQTVTLKSAAKIHQRFLSTK